MASPNIYLTVGISGSGKSRFAKYFCGKNKAIEINADEIRRDLGDISSQKNNCLVFKILESKITAYLAGGYDIFLSNTNLHLHKIRKICNKYPLNNVVIFIMDNSTDLDLCKKRVQEDVKNNVERSNAPMEIIERQYDNFLSLIVELRRTNDLPAKILVVNQDYTMKDFKNLSIQ